MENTSAIWIGFLGALIGSIIGAAGSYYVVQMHRNKI